MVIESGLIARTLAAHRDAHESLRFRAAGVPNFSFGNLGEISSDCVRLQASKVVEFERLARGSVIYDLVNEGVHCISVRCASPIRRLGTVLGNTFLSRTLVGCYE